MKMWSVLCFALCMMLAVAACSPAGTDSSAPKEEAAAVAPDSAPAAAPATEAAPAAPAEAAPAAAPAEAAPATDAAAAPAADAAAAPAAAGDPAALVGTTWKLGNFTLNFKDATKVNVKGGPFPDGMDADYKVEGGKFTVSVMGQSKTGTWDGTALVIGDKPAEKQ